MRNAIEKFFRSVIELLKPETNEYRNYLIDQIKAITDLSDENKEIKIYIENYVNNSNEFSDDKERELFKHILNEKIEKAEETRDIQALMLKNYDEAREYYKISKSQSRWSFWISSLACISGIIILGVTVYTVIILKQTDIAVIGIISGAIVELIAGTIFWLHNKSALQLNHYYDALHENEKVLLAINLTNTLSPEERENMCKEIIRTQIYKQKIDK